MMLLQGDPHSEALFAMRLRVPAGARLQPHTHPQDERVPILQGLLRMGFGEEFDAARITRCGPGSFYVNPAGSRHYVWIVEETVMQLTGLAPWEIRYSQTEPSRLSGAACDDRACSVRQPSAAGAGPLQPGDLPRCFRCRELFGRKRMLRVDTTAGNGARLLTDTSYQRGELIHRICRYRVCEHPTYQTVQIGRDTHIEDFGVLVHLNHSCCPNTRFDLGHLALLAERDIAAGDELTYFYPSTEWEMDRPFVCLCGAAECAGYIAGAKHFPPEKLHRYFLNSHIHELLAEKSGTGAASEPLAAADFTGTPQLSADQIAS